MCRATPVRAVALFVVSAPARPRARTDFIRGGAGSFGWVRVGGRIRRSCGGTS
jgi:hypothetical protein